MSSTQNTKIWMQTVEILVQRGLVLSSGMHWDHCDNQPGSAAARQLIAMNYHDDSAQQLAANSQHAKAVNKGRRKIEFESGSEDLDISQRTVFRFHALLPSTQVQGRYDTSPRPRYFVFSHSKTVSSVSDVIADTEQRRT